MSHQHYLRSALLLQATEGLDPWTALMRVLLARLRTIDLREALLPALAQADRHWNGQPGDLMASKLEVWGYIDVIGPGGADLDMPEGRVARALLCVLEPEGDDEAQSDFAEWFALMLDGDETT